MVELTESLLKEVAAWKRSVENAAAAKKIVAKEQELRKALFARLFPEPVEGTQHLNLGHGAWIKATYPMTREVDNTILFDTFSKLRELGVNPDPLINWKPSLNTAHYKTLVSIDSRAANVFEKALTVKPGSISMEFIQNAEDPNRP